MKNKNVFVQAKNEQDFFKRGKTLAQLADQGKQIPEQRILSFEDAKDDLQKLTKTALSKSP